MNFYRQVYLAITDFGFYARVFEQSPRRSLTYLLYLAAHVAIVLTAYYAWVILPATGRFLDWVEAELPPMRVENGVLTVDADPPVLKRYDGDMLWTIVVDPTGAYPDTRGLGEPVALLKRDQLFVRLPGGNNPPPLDWSEVPAFSVPDDIPAFRSTLNWLFFPLVYSLWLLWSLFWKAFQAMALAPIAILAASMYGIRLPLHSGFTIALYSLTPAIVIDLAVLWTGLAVDYFLMLYLAIGCIYTYMAAQRCSMAR